MWMCKTLQTIAIVSVIFYAIYTDIEDVCKFSEVLHQLSHSSCEIEADTSPHTVSQVC